MQRPEAGNEFKDIYFGTELLREWKTRRAGRQARLSVGDVEVSQVSQWSRELSGEVLEILHMREKHTY